MRRALSELWHARELVATLAERDLRARYKQAYLGFAWAVILPLMYMVVFTVFFQRVAKVETGHVPYELFSYVALVPWTFFSGAVSGGGTSLLSNLSILNKVYCPREVFPLASIVVGIVDTLIAISALVVLFVIFSYAPRETTVWVPLLVIIQIAFTLGVVFLVSSMIVYFRDLRQMIPIALQLGLFATPVAYPLHSIPKDFHVVYSLLNPLAPVIDGYRRTILLGHAPNWTLLGLGSISAVVLLVTGYWVFKRLEPGIADVA
jgi:ABC-type polysaccharide/polyol phosphate export permease